MNVDVMITMVFCLIVLFGSLAERAAVRALSAGRRANEAETKSGCRKKELIACKERSSAA
jgi:hypothetical protein